MHDGYLNTYTFSKDGKKINFASVSYSQLRETKPQKAMSIPISFSLAVNRY